MAKKSKSTEHRAPTPLELMLGADTTPSPTPSTMHVQRGNDWEGYLTLANPSSYSPAMLERRERRIREFMEWRELRDGDIETT